jgi:vacuolar-type H+-ATPase subunit H
MNLDRAAAEAKVRAEREAVQALETSEEHRAQQAKDAVMKQREALEQAISPADQRKQRGMRQISVWLTEEEHENLHDNARSRRMTMRSLILACLRPVTEKPL